MNKHAAWPPAAEDRIAVRSAARQLLMTRTGQSCVVISRQRCCPEAAL